MGLNPKRVFKGRSILCQSWGDWVSEAKMCNGETRSLRDTVTKSRDNGNTRREE